VIGTSRFTGETRLEVLVANTMYRTNAFQGLIYGGSWFVGRDQDYPPTFPAKSYRGDDLSSLDLVFSYQGYDKGTVWVRYNGIDSTDAINLTGQHGTLSENSNLCLKNCSNYIGYIVCSTQGYADFVNYYHKN
ncbi:MAG: hypothetical protein ACK56I_10510, partial [bacterium]